MLHAGASPAYARAWLPHPENALFVVGYQDAESPGRRLLELQQGGDVLLPDGKGGRETVPAYSRIERFYLSAHADRGGLIGLIARYQPGKILLTHGEVRARTNMAGYLNTRHEVSLPVAGEVVIPAGQWAPERLVHQHRPEEAGGAEGKARPGKGAAELRRRNPRGAVQPAERTRRFTVRGR